MDRIYIVHVRSLYTKGVLRYVKNKSAIYSSKKERKCIQFKRTAEYLSTIQRIQRGMPKCVESGRMVVQDKRRAATTIDFPM